MSIKNTLTLNLLDLPVIVEKVPDVESQKLFMIDKVKGKKRGRPCKSSAVKARALDCALCEFKAEDLLDLEIHMKTHGNQQVHECPHCNLIFSQRGNLITHMRTHTKDRPFKCMYCNFAATQKINLTAHIRTHTKEKPYKCKHCDYSTAQRCNLTSHMTRRHSNVEVVKAMSISCLTDTAAVKYYKCRDCNFHASQKKTMNNHIEAKHTVKVYDISKLVEIIID